MGIEGKVAKVLNTRDLVINKGESDGVCKGMLFQVIQPDEPIWDPDSGVELGVLARDKIKVRVVDLRPHFAVAKTYETYSAREPSEVQQAMSRLAGRTVTRVRKILTESPEQDGDTIGVAGSTVNVGDPVVQIVT